MAEFISAEFGTVELGRFIGQFGGIDRAARRAYMDEGVEPALHALLKEAIATYDPDAKVRIAIAVSPIHLQEQM